LAENIGLIIYHYTLVSLHRKRAFFCPALPPCSKGRGGQLPPRLRCPW